MTTTATAAAETQQLVTIDLACTEPRPAGTLGGDGSAMGFPSAGRRQNLSML